MILFIKELAQSVIIAIIFVVIIEMLLPDGANKKYVKMVSGIYIIYTILNPILGLFDKNININFFNNSSIEVSSEAYDEKLKKYYVQSMETTLKTQIEELR